MAHMLAIEMNPYSAMRAIEEQRPVEREMREERQPLMSERGQRGPV